MVAKPDLSPVVAWLRSLMAEVAALTQKGHAQYVAAGLAASV